MNQVVGQCCLQQTKFAVDGNSSLYASNWRLSARGHNVAHLTGSTRTWPPEDPKTANRRDIKKSDTTLKVKQADSDFAQNRKGPIQLKRRNV